MLTRSSTRMGPRSGLKCGRQRSRSHTAARLGFLSCKSPPFPSSRPQRFRRGRSSRPRGTWRQSRRAMTMRLPNRKVVVVVQTKKRRRRRRRRRTRRKTYASSSSSSSSSTGRVARARVRSSRRDVERCSF